MLQRRGLNLSGGFVQGDTRPSLGPHNPAEEGVNFAQVQWEPRTGQTVAAEAVEAFLGSCLV